MLRFLHNGGSRFAKTVHFFHPFLAYSYGGPELRLAAASYLGWAQKSEILGCKFLCDFKLEFLCKN